VGVCVAGLLLPAALPGGAKSPGRPQHQVAVLKAKGRGLPAENLTLVVAR
jgi:hypothetical protein